MGFFVFVFWILLSIVCAGAASSRGKSGLGFFFLSLIFSPIIGFLILLAIPKNDEALNSRRVQDGTHVICRHCKQAIIKGASICQYCGKSTAPVDPAEATADTRKCPWCAEVIKTEAKICRFCNRTVDENKTAKKGLTWSNNV